LQQQKVFLTFGPVERIVEKKSLNVENLVLDDQFGFDDRRPHWRQSQLFGGIKLIKKKKEKKVEEFRHFSKTVLRVLLIVRTDLTLMNSKTNH
jgi:hypothetical protein